MRVKWTLFWRVDERESLVLKVRSSKSARFRESVGPRKHAVCEYHQVFERSDRLLGGRLLCKVRFTEEDG
jgi:hypothetical protein